VRLYDYWRSSSAYRIRIALNLKGIEYEQATIPLVGPGGSPGEQHSDAYRAINPQGRVPFLEDGDVAIGQSMAILEYLEETYPEVPLLPADSVARARVRSFCNLIACDVQPLNNLTVMHYLKDDLGVSEDDYQAWYEHWIQTGFRAAEAAVSHGSGGDFVDGSKPTLADVMLVPQMYNARRFDVPLDDFPTLVAITDACNELSAFQAAAPEAQPDAP
jgi:maleylacetoacetate isomerase